MTSATVAPKRLVAGTQHNRERARRARARQAALTIGSHRQLSRCSVGWPVRIRAGRHMRRARSSQAPSSTKIISAPIALARGTRNTIGSHHAKERVVAGSKQITGSEQRLHSQRTIIDNHGTTAHGSRHKVEQKLKACKAASARDHIGNHRATAHGSERNIIGSHRAQRMAA
eukprot:scaffold30032_cov85-Phaeocystis_antarctica.AAC.1